MEKRSNPTLLLVDKTAFYHMRNLYYEEDLSSYV